jgi:hypothetical protein
MTDRDRLLALAQEQREIGDERIQSALEWMSPDRAGYGVAYQAEAAAWNARWGAHRLKTALLLESLAAQMPEDGSAP